MFAAFTYTSALYAYSYDVGDKMWYDGETAIGETLNITFSNAYILSAEEVENIMGMVEGVDWVKLTDTQFNTIFTIEQNQKYKNYVVKDLSKANLEWDGAKYAFFINDETNKVWMCGRLSVDYITFQYFESIEDLSNGPVSEYFYVFSENQWLNAFEEVMSSVPTITISNMRRMSVEEIKNIEDFPGEEYLFSDEQFNEIFSF